MSDGTAAINNVTNSYSDNAEYNPDRSGIDVAARGSDNQATEVNARVEDREAAESEVTGRIPRREVDELKANHFEGEGEDYHGRTRGVKNDPYKAERDVDQALDQAGIIDADQDVEISRASGRS